MTSFVLIMFGFPTGDLNPICNAPMLGAHQVTGPNAGGLRQLPMPTPLAARVGQFCRSAQKQILDTPIMK
jgi:hypothetical protein